MFCSSHICEYPQVESTSLRWPLLGSGTFEVKMTFLSIEWSTRRYEIIGDKTPEKHHSPTGRGHARIVSRSKAYCIEERCSSFQVRISLVLRSLSSMSTIGMQTGGTPSMYCCIFARILGMSLQRLMEQPKSGKPGKRSKTA